MILKKLSVGDMPFIRDYYGPDVAEEEILEIIRQSDEKSRDGRYFEKFGAWQDDVMIGMVNLYHYADGVITIGPDVLPQFRRMGYGAQILELACAKAKETGYMFADAPINTANAASIRLHEKCGFTLTGERISRHGNRHLVYTRKL